MWSKDFWKIKKTMCKYYKQVCKIERRISKVEGSLQIWIERRDLGRKLVDVNQWKKKKGLGRGLLVIKTEEVRKIERRI
jgi:hypothetical protein